MQNTPAGGHRFFYATGDATLYDDTVRLTDRAYDDVHEVLADVLATRLDSRAINALERRTVILDIGCGTGEEALRLLHRIPTCSVVCLDYSREMLDCFAAKLKRAYGDESAAGRAKLLQVDVRDPTWPEQALAVESGAREASTFGAVVSVYALHHLDSELKRRVYSDVATLLSPGSLFVNGDLFGFESGWLDELAQRREEDWIEMQFSSLPMGLAAALGPHGKELKESWIQHVMKENKPLPIAATTCPPDSDKGGLVREAELLWGAGFTQVEVPMRHYQSAVVVATR